MKINVLKFCPLSVWYHNVRALLGINEKLAGFYLNSGFSREDRSLLTAYAMQCNGESINMGITGLTARWYDPTNNTFNAATGSPFKNRGTTLLSPGGSNKEDTLDWVLILTATP